MVEKRKTKRKRVMMAIAIAVGIAAILWWGPVWLGALLVMGLLVGAVSDYCDLVEHKGIRLSPRLLIAIGGVFIIGAYTAWEGWLWRSVVLLFGALLFFFVRTLMRKENDGALEHVAYSFLAVIYIIWCLSTLVDIRLLPNGKYWMAVLLLSTKGGDMGAYLIGTFFGKHRLIPRISPKKSIEGAFGGVVFAIIGACSISPFLPGIPLGHLCLLAASVSVVAMLGDLAESVLKRDCRVKDSSSRIPGLGGTLDVVDSILFCVPLFYLYVIGFLGG